MYRFIKAAEDTDTRYDDAISLLEDDFEYLVTSLDKLVREDNLGIALDIAAEVHASIESSIANTISNISAEPAEAPAAPAE